MADAKLATREGEAAFAKLETERKRYEIIRELRADRRAISASTDPDDMAYRALLTDRINKLSRECLEDP